MATLIPSIGTCVSRMTSGERRLAERLEQKLDDDYLLWYDVPVGPKQSHPDFVVMHPRRGILILETKDWKLDTIQRATRQMWEIIPDGQLKVVMNPLAQARFCAIQVVNALERDPQLIQASGPHQGKLAFPWGHGVVLTRITRKQFDAAGLGDAIEPHYVICQDEMLETADVEEFQQRLWNMFPHSFGGVMSLPQLDRMRWNMFPEVRVQTQGALFDDSDAEAELPSIMRVMDLQQEQLARSLGDGHRVIHGVAGSGKTMILGYRAEYLAKAHTAASKPILILCYNEPLAVKLESVMQAKGLADKVHARNFHKWCRQQLVGEELKVYDTGRNQIELFKAPDDINLNVEDFNRKVITRPFNQAVCEYLAQEIDPTGKRKTLIFCVNTDHADLVVDVLKDAFEAQYGSVEDDAVIKITGNADKPLELIRRFKNERLPNVAVTVDLLTTGVDVPEICNLVFLRQVNSRILFDQMLGRATRLCDFDGDAKDSFRVFDAVRIFEAIGNMTAMRPVVVNPSITFAQLEQEMVTVQDLAARELVREQFLAKLQVKKRHLDDQAAQDFETQAGMSPDAFIQKLRTLSVAEVADWFLQNPRLGEILDRKRQGTGQPVYISDHPDALHRVDRGYGNARKPEDYLKEFKDFIASHGNELPALITVLTRPRDLTRKQLKELVLALDQAGFTEMRLAAAWRELSNQDIAARVIGYIRQAAIGDALLPYAERVDHALQKLLAKPPPGKPWTQPQRDWLKRIAAQTKANMLVDRDALDDPDLIFKREGGGFTRLDKLFNGQLQPVLEAFNDALWADDQKSA